MQILKTSQAAETAVTWYLVLPNLESVAGFSEKKITETAHLVRGNHQKWWTMKKSLKDSKNDEDGDHRTLSFRSMNYVVFVELFKWGK